MAPHETTWDALRRLIDAGDVPGTVAAVAAFDDAARRLVARELPDHIQVARDDARKAEAARRAGRTSSRHEPAALSTFFQELWHYNRPSHLQAPGHDDLSPRPQGVWLGDSSPLFQEPRQDDAPRHLQGTGPGAPSPRFLEPWEDEDDFDFETDADQGWIEPMRLAGAGVLSPAAAVAWINRRDFDRWDLNGFPVIADHRPLLDVIAARPPEWQADVAVRLALRVRPRRRGGRSGRDRDGDRNLALALALLRATGAAPPDHDPLVVGYVSRDARPGSLRTDPLLPHLLPRLFTAQGVGRALRDQQHGPLSWLTALRTLAHDGVVSRDLLLDGCRRRFLLGGDAHDLRFFARLHESLSPTEAEVEGAAIAYLRILPTAPGPIAELAMRHLRRLTTLGPADIAEGFEGLLFRGETGLVSAALAWLAAVLRDSPQLADALAPALTLTFGHRSRSVQEKAVRLAVRHARHFTPLGAATLSEAAGPLDDDLHNRLVAVFGGEPVEEQPRTPAATQPAFVPRKLPVPPSPAPAEAPPRTARHLAGLFLQDGWRAGERALAAFVRLAAEDRDGLRAALAPLVEPLYGRRWRTQREWMVALATELTAPGTAARPLPFDQRVSPMDRFIIRRHAEILAALEAGALPPLLLATPTVSTGHLDPAELVARLSELEAAGATPLPADFEQALLRLPRHVDPTVAARAAALRSPHGRRAAHWLAARSHDGPSAHGAVRSPAPAAGAHGSGEPLRDPDVRVAWSGADDGLGSRVWMTVTVTAHPAGLPLADEMLAAPPPHVNVVTDGHLGAFLGWWPSVLPSHREVVAAHLVPHQPLGYGDGVLPSSMLGELAGAGGPAGAAFAVLLAHRVMPVPWLGADPAEAFLALRRLAATGDLPAAEFGAELARRVLREEVPLRAVVDLLEAEAANGAHEAMWHAVVAALPSLLPAPGDRPTSAQTGLVTLAVTLARCTGARGAIPAVTALAARPGTSRIIRQAQALQNLLSPTP